MMFFFFSVANLKEVTEQDKFLKRKEVEGIKMGSFTILIIFIQPNKSIEWNY